MVSRNADSPSGSSDDESSSTSPTSEDLSSSDVTTKYRVAGDVTNAALAAVVAACVPGADVLQLCQLGDKTIQDATATLFNKKNKDGEKVRKGVAFPTCVSVNEVCGHFCPADETLSMKLKDGDVVKVDLGCHIDGYICVGAHTVVLTGGKPIEGRKADALKAAWTAAEAAARSIKVGVSSSEITTIIDTAAKSFNCTAVHGIMSHEVKRHVIEGSQCFAGVFTSAEDRPEEFQFDLNQVFGVDILISTGEGKARESEVKPSVYKRAVQNKYILKSALGRQFMKEVEMKFPTLPFTTRSLEDDRAALIGIPEALRHELLRPCMVYTEKSGEIVCQFKFTVLLLPGGTRKITGLPFTQNDDCKTLHEVKDEKLKKLLAVRILIISTNAEIYIVLL
eukprot:GHVT01086802.1.p1 GENE.GHVT01086802.1~~GHVT01086802.1.p1  ORF type:complete len:394 (-),score=48.21 GHVT01086802.1:1296-2477(-)